VAYPAYLREKARELRRSRQLSIDELAAQLSLSRSTIYYWVRDLPIPQSGPGGGWPESARRKAALANSAKFRQLREAAYESGRREFNDLALQPGFRDFVCLYLAEGSKRSRNAVAICNSDPAVVRLSHLWIRRLARNPVRYAVQYHADQKLAELTTFWAELLSVDQAAIKLQRKSNSNGLAGRNWRSRYGVLTVSSADTYLRARLEAWMNCLKESWV
jgi:predicted DNA-binding transcriptional regulator AlpA